MGGQDQQVGGGDDITVASQAVTLWGLCRERVRRCPDAIAYRNYDYTKSTWRDHSWREISERVDRFRAALTLANLKPADRIAILLPNESDWASFDIAKHGSGFGCGWSLSQPS